MRPPASYLESTDSTWEPEMEDHIQTSTVIDRVVEIVRPATDTPCLSILGACICCGRQALLDEDGCGICEECLAPDEFLVLAAGSELLNPLDRDETSCGFPAATRAARS